MVRRKHGWYRRWSSGNLYYYVYLLWILSSTAIRKGKIVWRWSESMIICGQTWVPKDSSTQATSEYIKCKNWICGKIKTTVFFLVISLLEHKYLYFIVMTLMCFQLIMPSGNCAIWGWSLSRTIPEILQYRSKTWGTTMLQLLLVVGW